MKQFNPTKSSDSQLLNRYEEGRDERAFAEIVRRHQSMVLATTRRVLRCSADAEDACQAAFLILAKCVGRVRNRNAVAGWLHNTAYRCAVDIRRSNSRWDEKKDRMNRLNEPAANQTTYTHNNPETRIANEELSAILDEELTRLPTKCHDAIVLCDLEGLSQKQAAKQLGVAQQTINDRVSKGRKLLRDRLVKRGVTLTVAGLATCVAGSVKPASAAVAKAVSTEIAVNATRFVAGASANEMGLSSSILQNANNVISGMKIAKLVSVTLAALAIVMGVGSVGVFVGSVGSAQAGTILFEDNFDDGQFANNWELAALNPGTIRVENGELVVGPTPQTDRNADVFVDLQALELQDSSMRARVRVTETGGSAVFGPRVVSRDDTRGYYAAVGHLPEFGGSVLFAGVGFSNGQQTPFPPTGVDVVVLPWDVRQEYTNVQLDVFGDEIKVWGWREDGVMPADPQIEAIDTTHPNAGGSPALHSSRTTQPSRF